MRRKIISPELIELETNVSYIPCFGFGEQLIDYNGPRCPLKLRYIVKRINEEDVVNTMRYNTKRFESYYETTDKKVYYEQPLGLGITLRMLLDYDKSEIIVNNNYHKLVRFNVHCISPPGANLKDLLCLKLLGRGFAPIHSSSFSYENEGVVIIAPSNTGKTWCVLYAVNNMGCKFLSEDISITNGKEIFGCPWTSTFIDLIDLRGFNRVLQIIFKNFPISRPFLRQYINVKSNNIMGNITLKAKLKYIFLLVRGEPQIKRLDIDEALKKAIILNRYEFPYRSSLINALQFFDLIDVAEFLNKEKKIIEKMIENAEGVYLLSGAPNIFVRNIKSILGL